MNHTIKIISKIHLTEKRRTINNNDKANFLKCLMHPESKQKREKKKKIGILGVTMRLLNM